MSAPSAAGSSSAPSASEASASTSAPGSAFESWRKSMAMFTGMGLSEAERAERAQTQEQQKLSDDWERCEKYKKGLMTTSPMLIFLLKHLRMAGCEFPSSAMQCHPCDETRAGGFSPEHGILLCQNRFMHKRHMEDTLAHELIHAYDHCRFKVDWMNLRHHACTEIRAANLSGDCNWSRERERGIYRFSKQHQACVKRRAILSVKSHPACKSDEMAEQAVLEVWDSCFADTRPFDEIY